MTIINIPAFSGLNILAAPQRIRENEATVAIGCDFRSLDLRPFRGDADTGMGTTVTQTIQDQGASIFQWDDTTWVGTLKDKSFARSPTFNSDATTGQRVFVADNDAPIGNEWDWVQDVKKTDLSTSGMRPIADGVASTFLSSTTRRLGVPKPAAMKMDEISNIDRRGPISSIIRSTKADTTITLPADSSSAINVADKIILFAPGIGEGPFVVSKKSDEATPKFTLRNTRLKYVNVTLIAKQGETATRFKKLGHGFSGGEQVILNKPAGTGSDNFINANMDPSYRTKVWVVEYDGPDHFTLIDWAGFPLTLTGDGPGNTKDWPFRIAVVATADDSIDPDGLYITTVATVVGDGSNQTVTLSNINATAGIEWQIALDTLSERSYVITYVNVFGDESEPSEPTKPILVADGDPVTFAKFPTTAATYTGDFVTNGAITVEQYSISQPNSQNINTFADAKIRVYRTDATGTYRLVTTEVDDERTIRWDEANTPWSDTYPDTELGEPLSTQGWQIPPKDLNGILISPGGSLVGYKGRVVVGSVPYAPYAVPISNRVAFDYPVKGLVATSAGIVVVTEGHPALIVGDDPATWSIQKLEYPYGCVSRRSIVDMGEMAIYASADGLVGVAGAAVEILTRDTIKREDWQALYNPKRVIAAHAEGRYYGITYLEDANGNVTSRKAFMFDPRTRSFIDLTVNQSAYPIALYSRLTDDTLLILKSDGKVYGWNRDTDYWVPYTWWSKWFQLTKPDIFGCAQILSPALLANHQVTMTLYGWDGESVVQVCQYTTIDALVNPAGKVYKFDKNVNPFRLPVPDNRYTVYTVKLEGTLPIGQVTITSTIDEIKSV